MVNLNRPFPLRAGVLVLLFVISVTQGLAQQANYWVMDNYEVNFKTTPPTVTQAAAAHPQTGVGSICDQLGNLLFYTDGYSVWNRNHQTMPNGGSLIPILGGSMQKSMVIPKPGSTNIYYIFTVDPSSTTAGLFYSEVDMTLAAGKGDVTTKGVNLIKNLTAGLSAVLHENRQDVWLTTHALNSNTYYTILITSSGISGPPIEQKIGTAYSYGGPLKFSPDGRRFAVLTDSQQIELFDFDPATGVFSNPRVLSFTDLESSPLIAGLEFSSDGTRLYSSELRMSQVYQFNVSLPTVAEIQASRNPINGRVLHNNLYEFQLAPDGKIYITKGGGGGGSGHLGIIENPNDEAANVTLSENGLDLNGGDSFTNITPSFVQDYFFKTSFSFDRRCQAAPIQFEITNQYRIDSVKWFFGEGSTSKSLNPTFSYPISGDYTVTLHAYYGNQAAVISRPLMIDPYTSFELGADATMCEDSRLSIDDNYVSYHWSTGDTTRWTRIRQSGLYELEAENEFGCFFKDALTVTMNPLPVINLPDTVIMNGQDSVALIPGSFSSYSWNTGETTPSIYAKDAGWYSVAVNDSQGCMSAASVYVGNYPEQQPAAPRWIRINPAPSGQTARDMHFLDEERGFIVNGKELLRTTDGGATWTIQQQMPASRIAFHDMIGYAVGDGGTVYRSTHRGDGWNKLAINSFDNFNAVTVLHEDTLFITSDSRLFKSFNGGKTWSSTTITLGVNIEDSYFINARVGHAVCMNGKIIKTTDGGTTWRVTYSTNTSPSTFFRIRFATPLIGFATREHSEVFKTIDGGETWKAISSLDAGYVIQFLNENIGYLAGEHGAIHKTTNGGVTWQWIGGFGRIWANDLRAIQFIDENIGFAAGMRGRILKTVDGGVTWKEYGVTYTLVHQAEFATSDVGFIVSGTSLFKTMDGGSSWTKLSQESVRVDFVSPEVGYAMTATSVYKTTDGGQHWTKTNANGGYLIGIQFLDENTGFVYGSNGQLLATTNGGQTWSARNATFNLGKVQFITAEVGYARNSGYDYSRIYKTENGGATWNLVFEIDPDIYSFHFANESVGYCVGYPGANFKTINGGATWQALVSLPYEYYLDVEFLTPTFGYALNEEGQIFRTRNGGATWQIDFTTYGLYSLSSTGDEAFAAGEFGSVFKTAVTIEDLFEIHDLTLIAVTDTTATLAATMASFHASPATVTALIGPEPGVYTREIPVDIPAGVFTNQLIRFSFGDLQPETVYYCKVKAIRQNGTVSTPDYRFTTMPPPETVTGLPESIDDGIRVFPNPTSGGIRVSILQDASQEFSYTVYDLQGTELMGGESYAGDIVDISDLPPGLYVLRISTQDQRQNTTRVIKR